MKKLRKRIYRPVTIALLVVFLLSLVPVSANSDTSVISEALREYMESEEFRTNAALETEVMIWLDDSVDNEKAMAMAEKVTGLSVEELTSSVSLFEEDDYAVLKDLSDEEYMEKANSLIDTKAKKTEEEKSLSMNRLIDTKRSISRAMYEEQSQSYLDSISLLKENYTYISKYSPVIFASLTVDEIQRLAKDSNVNKIAYISNSEPVQEDFTVSSVIQDAYGEYNRDTLGWSGNGVKIGILEGIEYVSTYAGISDLRYTENPKYLQSETGSSHADTIGAIIAGSNGFAPDATVYSTIKYPHNLASGYFQGAERLIDAGVHIINCSFGISDYSDGQYTAADKWFDHITSQHNITFIKSAGNGANKGNPYITSPGMAFNAITVGAHTGGRYAVDTKDVCDFSAFDEYAGIAQKPDILAYGGVVSFNGSRGGGTSYAAASVTGVIAQLMQGNAALKERPTLVKAIICAGARKWCNNADFCGSWYGIHSFSEDQGAGMIRAKTAASILSNGRYYYTSGGTTSDSISASFTVTSSDAIIKVCMTWEKRNKYDGSHGVGDTYETPRITNWNLKITTPSGAVLESKSTYNNVELICFDPSEYGTGTYRITATKESGIATREYLSIAWY